MAILIISGIVLTVFFLAWAIASKNPSKQIAGVLHAIKSNVLPILLVCVLVIQSAFLFFLYQDLNEVKEDFGTIVSWLDDIEKRQQGDSRTISDRLQNLEEDTSFLRADLYGMDRILKKIADKLGVYMSPF